MSVASRQQIASLRAHAVDDVTREIMCDGVTLSHAQADDLGEETLAWIRDRLGLSVTETDEGVECKQTVDCECAHGSDEACAWSGPIANTTIVETMPYHHRASHTAAGNSGRYPHNGALRLRVERSCADRMVEADGEWTRIIDRSAS